MNATKKAKRTDDTNYPVITADDGQMYVDPLESGGKYLVRKYDIPDVYDLGAFKEMLHDFQQRMLRNVSRGDTVQRTSVDTLDAYIVHERSRLEGIQQELSTSNSNEASQDQEALSRRWLATALVARAMRLSKFHIKKRIEADHDNANISLHKEVILDNETVTRISKILLDDIQDPNPSDTNYALYKKIADDQRQRIHLLGSRGADPQKHPHPHLELIDNCISRDTAEAYGLAADLRNKRGHFDIVIIS